MARRHGSSRHGSWSRKPRVHTLYWKCEAEKANGSRARFSILKAHSQWHTSASKGISSKLPQTASPTRDQMLKYQNLWGTFSFTTIILDKSQDPHKYFCIQNHVITLNGSLWLPWSVSCLDWFVVTCIHDWFSLAYAAGKPTRTLLIIPVTHLPKQVTVDNYS